MKLIPIGAIVVLVIVVVALIWERGNRESETDEERQHYLHLVDSLTSRADIYQASAERFEAIADRHRERADSLQAISPRNIIDHALRSYHDASLDSVRDLLLSEPSRP